MTPDELRSLIAQPESDVLEFKTRLADARTLALHISAFANTKGGTLIVGVKEGGSLYGVQEPTRLQKLIEDVANRISPPINVESDAVTLDGKSILVVKIPHGVRPPYFADGQAFRRKGDQVTMLSADELYGSVQQTSKSVEDVLAEVKRLYTIIENLNHALDDSKSWKNKISDMVLGGIIGAVISIVLAALLRF